MIASFLIIGFSLVLFAYWFRYSCILLLRNEVERAATARDARFHVAELQEGLKAGGELDPLHVALDRDYKVLIYLLQHAAGLELQSFEDRLLVLDYRVMNGWYRLTRTLAPLQARRALSEMVSILGVLVRRMGEQAGVQHEV